MEHRISVGKPCARVHIRLGSHQRRRLRELKSGSACAPSLATVELDSSGFVTTREKHGGALFRASRTLPSLRMLLGPPGTGGATATPPPAGRLKLIAPAGAVAPRAPRGLRRSGPAPGSLPHHAQYLPVCGARSDGDNGPWCHGSAWSLGLSLPAAAPGQYSESLHDRGC